jgi:deoxyribonuclease-4
VKRARRYTAADAPPYDYTVTDRFGAHMPIAGGLDRAVREAVHVGASVFQIFSHSPSRWLTPKVPPPGGPAFVEACAAQRVAPVAVHGAYLINLASPDRDLRRTSIRLAKAEVAFAGSLGIPSYVLHPGAHRGAGTAKGIERVRRSLGALLKEAEKQGVRIVLENTAGQATVLGGTVAELAAMIGGRAAPAEIGICLDTCHLFAAGYDIRTPKGIRSLLAEVETLCGLQRIALIHANDSRKALGFHVDRHADIGSGEIGIDGFAPILRARRLKHVPVILETPKDGAGDRENLRRLRALVR